MRRPNPYDSLTKSVNDDLGDNDSDQADQVSPEERRQACEALKPNGCGPAGWKNFIIRNNPGGFDLTEVCNNHDRRYGTLGFDKDEADRLFLREGTNVVLSQTSSTDSRRTRGISEINKYYQAVRQYGTKPYTDAQRNAFICENGKKP